MIKLPAAKFFHETVSLKLLKHFSKKRKPDQFIGLYERTWAAKAARHGLSWRFNLKNSKDERTAFAAYYIIIVDWFQYN
jgi:hypothetical protein